MLTELFQSMEFWHWWVFAIILLIVEVLASGTFFLWMAAAAVLVGFGVWLFPGLPWEYQWIAFAILSIASLAWFKSQQKKHPESSDQPNLNRRGHQYVGRNFTLAEAIINGQGKVRVDDSTWKITGPDCPEGSRVRVTGVEGTVLEVELLDS